MPGKRNDAEGNMADREMAFTWITSAWIIVLSILFWATTPSPRNRSIRFSIQGNLAGDVVCAGNEGECAEGTEMIRTGMPQEFDAPPAMVWTVLTDPKQVSLLWWPTRLTTMIDGMDVRTGRVWRLVMHGSDGRDYPNQSAPTEPTASTEPASYERLGYEFASSKRGVPATQVEMMATFVKEGKTLLTIRMVFVSGQTAGDEEEPDDAWRTAA
jgi:uncharacterized protein YndB with AHSA1/START domain